MSQVQKGNYSDTATISNNIFLEHSTTFADVTGARVVVDGLEVSAQRVGNFVQLHLKPSSVLSTGTNAVATTTINAIGAIPEAFRPLSTIRVPATVNANGIAAGEAAIQPTGNIVYFAMGALNFTTGQPAAIIGDVCIAYDRRLAAF